MLTLAPKPIPNGEAVERWIALGLLTVVLVWIVAGVVHLVLSHLEGTSERYLEQEVDR